jgi:hypothetical protein
LQSTRLAGLLSIGQKADSQSADFHFKQARAVGRVGNILANLDSELLRDFAGCIGVGNLDHGINAGRVRRGNELDATARSEHLDAVTSALVPLVASGESECAKQLQRWLKIIQRLAERAGKDDGTNHECQ